MSNKSKEGCLNPLPLYPKMKQSFAVLENNVGDVSVGQRGGSAFIIKCAPEWLKYCITLLDGGRNINDITKLVRLKNGNINLQDITRMLEILSKINALEDGKQLPQILSDQELELYDRQILGLSLAEKEGKCGFFYQELLKKQKVLVFGGGGWGSWIILNLALAGFGNITIVDGDKLELSNLNRQVLYNHNDIGKFKALAAKENLKKINPYIQVHAIPEFISPNKPEKITEIIENKTLIFIAWSNLAYFRSNLNEEVIHRVAYNHNIPIIEVCGNPFEVTVGPIFINNGSTLCFNCIKEEIRNSTLSNNSHIRSFQELHITEFSAQKTNYPPSPQNSSSLSIMSGLAVDQAIKLASNVQDIALGAKKFRMNLQTLEVHTEIYKKNHLCEWGPHE